MKLNLTKLIAAILLSVLIAEGCSQNINLPTGVEFQATDFVFVSIDWAPDSERLAVASPEVVYSGIHLVQQKPSEIFVWNPDIDSYSQVSDQEYTYTNSDPVWNPKQEQIMFYSRTEFGDQEQTGIIDIGSGEKFAITKFGPPMDWFPDGLKIIVGESNSLLMIDVVSKQMTPGLWRSNIPNEEIFDLAISPDGQQIAVLVRDYPSPVQLWFVSKDGNEDFLILENQFMKKINWSPNGQWLIFVGNGGLFALRPDNNCITDVLAIQETIQDIDWAPNGQQIAIAVYEGKKQGVYFYDTDSEFIQEWLVSGNCSASE
ncbi:MAG: PD40 domain-containing protein [Ardenticatenaceae bacterium]|nr:PD40 domain-containing protein [Anaerolineales bacterium]MCB8920667.1 PD40 domain-containing protein [Ardenticatenaceae bacterium]MCB9002917.1 PD40 domain-containing protein [Ardenticatenaceae bacterium]